jgi:DNA-binding IclR family transcriptional regulator
MRCVAVPILDKDGRATAGISLSGPASRYTMRKLASLKSQCLVSARALSKRLGGMADG